MIEEVRKLASFICGGTQTNKESVMPIRVLYEDAVKVFPHKKQKMKIMRSMHLECENDGIAKKWFLMGINRRGIKSVVRKVNSKNQLYALACIGNETTVGNYEVKLHRPLNKNCWAVFPMGGVRPISSGMSFDEAMLYAKFKNNEPYHALTIEDKKEAVRHIKNKGVLAQSAAREHSQSLSLVQGMRWFINEVAKQINLRFQ